jgi:serine/threonine protein phosphatase PrpC
MVAAGTPSRGLSERSELCIPCTGEPCWTAQARVLITLFWGQFAGAMRTNLIAETIFNWLEIDTLDRAEREVEGMFVLATDIGTKRPENQDKAAVLRVGSAATHREFWCACICDGMGGLREGKAAASNALSTFLASLVAHRKREPKDRLDTAVREASGWVAQVVQGGGSTLSAALFEGGSVYTVNVGDSRIYALNPLDDGDFIERLTVDDTMEEAYGAEGRGLLQFVGMKSGLLPHINEVSNRDLQLVLTTDGAHFIGDDTLRRIRANAPDPRSFCTRVLDTARWLGSADNATLIVSKASAGFPRNSRDSSPDISVWTTSGRLKIAWTPSSQQEFAHRQKPVDHTPDQSRTTPTIKDGAASEPNLGKTSEPPPSKKSKSRSKKQKRQQIEIGFSDDGNG